MDGQRRGETVRVGGDARQRYFDSSGYGRPHAGGVELAPVEAAHLLYRGDLDTVEGQGFRAYFDELASEPGFVPRFLVYADLRERGFYVSPAREGWPGYDGSNTDLTVFARGNQPGGEVGYRVRVVGERTPVSITATAGTTLAVADEESEVSYFAWESGGGFDGQTTFEPPSGLSVTLLADRAICWEPPTALYESGFYGQPVSGRDAAVVDALQLSLVETAHLAQQGTLDVAASAVTERGRAVEGERFDRRLAAYRDLRARGVVPKTGFKFGADFRTYDEVTTVDELGHSETLVRVVEPQTAIGPRELALDVRLAGGVRKRTVFALTDGNRTDYVTVTRLTP